MMPEPRPRSSDTALGRESERTGLANAGRGWARALAPLGKRKMTVLVDVSNKCNIRCRMCYFHFDSVFHRRAQFMQPAMFDQLAARLFPLAHTVYLSAGNEPLTSPHFEELLQIAAPYAVPDLKFLTNALLVTPRLADAIARCGVNQVHISIDGATKETYESIRVGGKFKVLKRGVQLLAEARARYGKETPHLQFNVTLMRSNLGELESFVDLAEELGVTRIAARHLMPYEGLDMEGETLQGMEVEANLAFERFLTRAASSPSVRVVNWPDFFAIGSDELPEHAGVAGPRHTVEEAASAAPRPEDSGGRTSLPRPRSEHGQRSGSEVDEQRRLPLVPRATLGSDTPPPGSGSLDLPKEDHLPGAAQVTFGGWALDATGIENVWIEREPFPGEDPALDEFGLVRIGRARFLPGARPDVVFAHGDIDHGFRHAFAFNLERSCLPTTEPLEVVIHVIAEAGSGRTFEVGHRRLVYDGVHESPPPRSCEKPFENVYIDSSGNLYPYPDCQGLDPFGNITDPVPFEDVWFGEEFTDLRERILAGDPPDMCLQCPNFINRNVNDERFFSPREVEGDYRRPVGHVDTPDEVHRLEPDGLTFRGWALGFEEFAGVRVELLEEDRRLKLGEVQFEEGSRADVSRLYPRYPNRDRAGWTFSLRHHHLESSAPRRSPSRLVFIAYNKGSGETVLGSRLVLLGSSSEV